MHPRRNLLVEVRGTITGYRALRVVRVGGETVEANHELGRYW